MPATATEHHWTWTVAYVDGAARTGEGNGVWWSMQLGEDVRPGSHIETGLDGRITLVHGGDSIEVAPNSEFSVSHRPGPAEGAEHEDSDIIQTFGSLLFRMESRESRDFTVDTPFLAAAIKGTTFTVSVSRNKSVVAVEEGSVEVTAERTGEIALVEAGGSVSAARGAGMDVISGPDPVNDKPEKSDAPESDGSDRGDRGGRSGGGTGGGGSGTGTGGTTTTDPGGTTSTTDSGGTTTTDSGGTTTTDSGGTTSTGSGGTIGDFASGIASPKK